MNRTTATAPVRPGRRRRALLVGVAAAVGLGALAVPAGATPAPMSVAKARTVYLGVVCPFNALQAERAKVSASLQAAGTPTAVGSPMPAELRASAPEYVRLARRANKVFAGPPAPWPAALQPYISVATAYSAVMLQRAVDFDAATIPAAPPNWETMVAAQKVNLPLLRTAFGFADGTDPCAGRAASEVTIQTVPDGY